MKRCPQSFRDSIGFFRSRPCEGGAGRDTSWVGGPGVALFVNARLPAKDKAEEFVKFFVEQWGQRAVAEAGVIPGTIVDTSKVDLPGMYLDVLDELAAASSITLFADVQLSPAAAQVHLNQIQALFGLQVTPEQFAGHMTKRSEATIRRATAWRSKMNREGTSFTCPAYRLVLPFLLPASGVASSPTTRDGKVTRHGKD